MEFVTRVPVRYVYRTKIKNFHSVQSVLRHIPTRFQHDNITRPFEVRYDDSCEENDDDDVDVDVVVNAFNNFFYLVDMTLIVIFGERAAVIRNEDKG